MIKFLRMEKKVETRGKTIKILNVHTSDKTCHKYYTNFLEFILLAINTKQIR